MRARTVSQALQHPASAPSSEQPLTEAPPREARSMMMNLGLTQAPSSADIRRFGTQEVRKKVMVRNRRKRSSFPRQRNKVKLPCSPSQVHLSVRRLSPYPLDFKAHPVSLASDETLGRPEEVRKLMPELPQDLSEIAVLIMKSIEKSKCLPASKPWSHLKAP